MKFKNRIFLLSLIVLSLTGCGSSSDDSLLPVIGNNPFLSLTSSLEINSSNQSAFTFSGVCRGVEEVVVLGNVDATIPCNAEAFSQSFNLSYLPNGVHKISVKAGEETVEIEVKKDTLNDDAQAHFSFSDSGDLGKDETGNHDAQSVTDVVDQNDSERGVVAQFNGSTSGLQLSDGSFFNDEFSERTFTFYMKNSSYSSTEMIVDEGGSTNGAGLRIENDQLIFGTRNGGSGTQTEVSVSLAGLENQWLQVTASFSNGELSLSVNDNQASVTAAYSTVSSHGDTGGIGKEYGSSVFDNISLNPFSGMLSSFRVFSKKLTSDEIVLLKGETPEAKEFNSLDLGKLVSLDFQNASDLGENGNSGLPNGVITNVTQVSDADKGFVANFDGTSKIRLSNGTFWNKAFKTKSYALYFKASDLQTEQVLFEEGGSTNGISLRIENGYLFAEAAANSVRESLIEDVLGFQDEWIKVVVQFSEGEFKMSVFGEDSQISRSASFSEIPDHSSHGGLGMRDGGDASGNSGTAAFTGLIHKFSTYSRTLTESEIKKY